MHLSKKTLVYMCINVKKRICSIETGIYYNDLKDMNFLEEMNMFRKGRFAIWNGVEYPVVSQKRKYYLQSDNENDIGKGFSSIDREDVFFKEVILEELEDAYEIFPYAILSGYRFAMESFNEKNGKITLVTNNPYAAKKVNVSPHGKGGFHIEMPFDEITVLEDRVPILGFEE